MKKLILALALTMAPAIHADPVPVGDLRAILNDFNSWLADTKMSILDSIEVGPVGSCGPNSPAYYTITFKQNWNTEPCRVTIAVVAGDGNCRGDAPRAARIAKVPACFDNKFDKAVRP